MIDYEETKSQPISRNIGDWYIRNEIMRYWFQCND